MGDNNEQEDADLDAMNNDDDDNLFEVVYRGGSLSDNDIYDIPADVFIRLRIDLSVTEIDSYACYGCTMLTEVRLHKNVTRIGRSAFGCCSNLKRVELPEGLLRIEHDAFLNCTSLIGEIVIPASVQFIGNSAFYGCKSLERIVFAPTTNVVELGRYMFFDCSNLRFITLPHNLRVIPHRCFDGCTSLKQFLIPASLEVIEEGAFYGSAIESIVMLENVNQIDRAAFKNCSFLKKITFHSTTLTFANNVFVNCPSLTVIMIAPWLWPKLLVSMNRHPDFIFKFFRQYQTQIFDFEIDNMDVEVEVEVQGSHHNNIEDNNE